MRNNLQKRPCDTTMVFSPHPPLSMSRYIVSRNVDTLSYTSAPLNESHGSPHMNYNVYIVETYIWIVCKFETSHSGKIFWGVIHFWDTKTSPESWSFFISL